MKRAMVLLFALSVGLTLVVGCATDLVTSDRQYQSGQETTSKCTVCHGQSR